MDLYRDDKVRVAALPHALPLLLPAPPQYHVHSNSTQPSIPFSLYPAVAASASKLPCLSPSLSCYQPLAPSPSPPLQRTLITTSKCETYIPKLHCLLVTRAGYLACLFSGHWTTTPPAPHPHLRLLPRPHSPPAAVEVKSSTHNPAATHQIPHQ